MLRMITALTRHAFGISALVLISSLAMAQFDSFQKEYETQYFTHCYDIASTLDGGFIISGIQDLPTADPSGLTPYVTRVGCDGEPIWTKRYAETSGLNNTDHEVAVISQNEYVLVSSVGETNSYDILVVKMDSDGNTLWAKTYGGDNEDLQGGVTILSDGNIAVVGCTKSYGINAGTSHSDMYALKIDASNGDIIWSATFGFSGTTGRAYDVVENDVGGIAFTGSIFHDATIATWAPLVNLDADGNFLDATFYGMDDRNTMGLGLSRTSDGGYFLSGTSNILGTDWFDTMSFPFVIKTNATSDLVWGKVIDGTPNVSSLGGIAYSPIDNGDTVAVAIETYFYETLTTDPSKRVLCLFNSNNGELINARQYNTEGGQFPKIKHDIDGGFLMSAMTDENNGSDPDDQWWNGPIINKLDAQFNSGCNETDRTLETVLQSPDWTVNNSLSFDLISDGGVFDDLDAAADSFAVHLPNVETLCESMSDIDVSFEPPVLTCGELTAFFEAGINYPYYEVEWDFGDGEILNTGLQDSITHVYETSGTFDVSVTVNICGTNYIETGQVMTQEGGFDATIDPTLVGPFCSFDDIITLTSLEGGGVWSGPGITDASEGTFDPSQANEGVNQIIYAQCFESDTIDIEILAIDDPGFSYDSDVYCIQDVDPIADVTGAAGGEFTIDNFGVIDATLGTISLEASGFGTFNVTYTTLGQCPSDSTFTISIEGIDVTISDPSWMCDGAEPVILEADVPGGLWTGDGIVNGLSGEFDPVVAGGPGEYNITYQTAGECPTMDTTLVVVLDSPYLTAGFSQEINLGDSVMLQATGTGTVQWSPPTYLSCTSCSNPIASPFETTIYTVVLTDVYGCQKSEEILIEVNYQEVLYIPNIFSPNGDSENDVFRVRGTPILDFKLLIFDRWGKVVFETLDQREAWDGSSNGQDLQPGSYVYQLTGRTPIGDLVSEVGSITLIR